MEICDCETTKNHQKKIAKGLRNAIVRKAGRAFESRWHFEIWFGTTAYQSASRREQHISVLHWNCPRRTPAQGQGTQVLLCSGKQAHSMRLFFSENVFKGPRPTQAQTLLITALINQSRSSWYYNDKQMIAEPRHENFLHCCDP